jgi:transposase-like protein
VRNNGSPRAITFDRYAASHQAVAKLKAAGTLPRRVRIRSCKYLNNVTLARPSPDKTAGRPMLGFKRFETAVVTICGIELAEKIKKNQFNLETLTGSPRPLQRWSLIFQPLTKSASVPWGIHRMLKYWRKQPFHILGW